MADTTADPTPDTDLPDRYMVLSDGETYEPLTGSKIVEISHELEGEDRDAAIKARCQEDDTQAGEGVTVLYTANGFEPGLAGAQRTLPLGGTVALVAAAPTPTGEIRGERRTVILEFLGDKGTLSADDTEVTDMLARASTEDLLCDVKTTALEPLDSPTLARLAREARSDPEFFGLDQDGTPLHPDEL